MEKVTISAATREGIGVKGALSKIRAEKKIPAVIYGGHKEPVSVTVSVKDLDKIVKAGKNTLVEIDLGGAKELALVNQQGELLQQAGHVDVYIGGGQPYKSEGVFYPLSVTGEVYKVY